MLYINSGIPNRAFALFAQAAGGNAWEQALKVWYDVCTGGRLNSDSTFVDFAQLTIEAGQSQGGDALGALVRQAWDAVNLPLGAS